MALETWFDYEHVTTAAQTIAAWRPPSNLIDLLGLVGVVALIYYVAWLLDKVPFKKPTLQVRMGEDAMARHFRNQRIKFMIGEGITDLVEDLVFKNKISRADAMDIYYKFGHTFGIEGLVQKKPIADKLSKGQMEYLKSQIKERIHLQTMGNVTEIQNPVRVKKIIGKGYLKQQRR